MTCTLASLTLTDSADDPVASWSYTYDALYRIRSQTHAGDPASGATNPDAATHTYAYDPGGRLDAVDVDGSGPTPPTDVTYDAAGNRTAYGTQSWTYNRDNSVATHDPDGAGAAPATAFAYHPFGGLAHDRCSDHSYDGFDRLDKTVSDATPADCKVFTTDTTYDGAGRVATSATGAVTTTFAYDGLTTATVAADTATTTDTTAYGVSLPVLAHRAGLVGGGERYLTNDGNGNVSYVVDGAEAPVCTTRFDPFGNPRNPGPDGICATTNGAPVVNEHAHVQPHPLLAVVWSYGLERYRRPVVDEEHR